MNPSPTSPIWHTLVATVENKPGVLARVAGLFSRRGFNIHSLAVAPTDDEHFSRITFTVDIEGTPLDQVVKQLDKLINVVDISELNPADSVERELMMCTVGATEPEARREVIDLVQIFDANVLNVPSVLVNNNGSARVVTLDEQPTTTITARQTSATTAPIMKPTPMPEPAPS